MVSKSKQFVSQSSIPKLLFLTPPLCSFRSVRNFIIDLRQIPHASKATGLHWQVSQATSLINVRVEMSTKNGTNHQGAFSLRSGHLRLTHYFLGIFMENGR